MLGRTDFMSLTNANLSKRGIAGFTLVEMIVSMSLSAIVFAAILSGFTFLGRSLTRLVNTRDQEAKGRRTFYIFKQDINAASQVASGSNASLSLKLPAVGGATTSVHYSYDATAGTFTRTDGSSVAVLLTNLKKFDFNYFNAAGSPLSLDPSNPSPSTPSVLGVKEVEMNFTSAVGAETSGVQSSYTSVSPRLVLRNKALLQ